MNYLKCILSNQKENPLVYKGLNIVVNVFLDGGSEDMAHIGNGVVLISSVSSIDMLTSLMHETCHYVSQISILAMV